MLKTKFVATIRATGDEPSICISTPSEDRDGDIVEPSGCDLTNYRRNPVVLWAHDYSEVPVGRCTGIQAGPDGIVASWRWTENDPLADRVRNAFDQRIVSAASIGFRPREVERTDHGLRYVSWELLEFSLVPVPANPDAVRTLKGLRLWHVEGPVLVVRDDDGVLVIRDEDDDLIVFDPADFAAAFSEAAAESLAEVIQHETARGIARSMGRIDDPLLGDRVHRQRVAGGVDLVDVQRALVTEVPALVMETLRSIGPLVRDETARALRMARGRLD